jgi:hypothetical protein
LRVRCRDAQVGGGSKTKAAAEADAANGGNDGHTGVSHCGKEVAEFAAS